jgi:hypothetical protein
MKMDKLEQLWSIAEIQADRKGLQFPFAFDPIGLNLIRPITREHYDSTPMNSMAFAKTGGDGVHFSFVQLKEEISNHSPVVMTVPMNYGSENLIVGSDFKDFLCLGCEVGYNFLELLTYTDAKSDAIYWLNHPEEWFTSLRSDPDNGSSLDDKKNLLRLLRYEFDLQPWENIEDKLQSLEDKYLSLLELKSDQP